MANRFHNPRPQFMNATPAVYSAGVLRFYQSGTSTPLNVYANSDLTSASTTITLNSAGRPSQDIFLSTLLYKVTLEDSLGNLIWSVDPYMTSDYTTTAKVTGYSGNPNTFVAGTASAGAVPADMVWDRTNHILYVCTTTGNAAAAVWTVANSTTGLSNWTTAGRNVSPVAGVDFGYNTTLHTLDFWDSTRWVSILPSTRQYLISGTTYTTPAGCRSIVVKMIGGGGGAGATATNNGATGGTTTFNSITAIGGGGGVAAGSVARQGGAGGTGGAGSASLRLAGSPGGNGSPTTTGGGNGGSGIFGTGSGLGAPAQNNSAGGNAAANSGAGGGGADSAGAAAGGGGAGEYVEIVIAAPAATYTYAIGTAGAGGAAGTNAGGNGGTGIIIVEEYY